MGLFTKKITVTIVFAGKYRSKLMFSDEKMKALLKPMIPQIIEKKLGSEAANRPRVLLAFREWSSKDSYSPEFIRDVAEHGFSAFNLDFDRKHMLDDIDRTLMNSFGCSSSTFHPACFMFPSNDPMSGVFLLMYEQKVKEDRLK